MSEYDPIIGVPIGGRRVDAGSEGLALHYLRRAEAAEAEVERLKGVLEEIANTLKYAPDDEGVKALYDFARSALEAKP